MKKKILTAIVVSAIIIGLWIVLCGDQESTISTNEPPTIYSMVEGMSAELGYKVTDNAEKMMKDHPEFFTNDYNTLSHDDMSFMYVYNDLLMYTEEFGDDIVFLASANVINKTEYNEGEFKMTTLEVLDLEDNYFYLISGNIHDDIEEGSNISGYFVPVGKMEFVNKRQEESVGIAGAVCLIGSN